MNKLVSSIKEKELNKKTTTANGMKARVSTANHNLDLFFKIGASRGKNISEDFANAYSENKEHALRIAMWARDIRGGAGERQLYLDIIKQLELIDYKDAIILIDKIKDLGRYKDLFQINFTNQYLQNHVFSIAKKAIFEDNNALAAKWTPRKGIVANKFRKYLNLLPKDYRKALSERSNTIEQKMSKNDWSDINYSHVPSLAMSRYKKAFKKHDESGFDLYKTSLQDGTAKINAGAVYPYNILHSLLKDRDEVVAKAQWDALPNYLNDARILPMVDVSGSMDQLISAGLNVSEIALSLGIYISDKSKGSLKNTMLTFSGKPALFVLDENLSLLNKVSTITTITGRDCLNTDLGLAFKELLSFSSKNNVPAEDMPEYLLILSDMQFDYHSIRGKDVSALKMIKNEYKKAGYEMPKLVFWNLKSYDNVPAKFNSDGVALISGFSPSIMKSVLGTKNFNPMDVMLETIMNERYN